MTSETKKGSKWPKIFFVPRRTRQSKVEPFDGEKETKSESPSRESDFTRPLVSKLSTISIPLQSSTETSARTSTTNFSDSDVTKASPDKPKRLPWKKSKVTICVVAIIAIVLLCAAAAILPPVFLIVLRSSSTSSFSNVSVSMCSSQTCIGSETPFRTSMITASYLFDGNTLDQSGSLGGTPFGLSLPSYSLSWTATNSLAFTSSSQQYVSIPYINLTKQSFTLEMWLNPSSVAGQVDYGVFGQCGSDLICLSLSIRNSRVTLSFDSLNNNSRKLSGSSVLVNNNWNHVTVIYDAVKFQQMIYVNGRIDAVSTGMVYPYQGTSLWATTTIAMSTSLGYQPSYFNGNIYLFTISAGVARSVCQVYNDATLTAYYPLNAAYTLADYSVNLFNGYSSGTTVTSSGHVQEAMVFSQNTSCFQAACFTSTRAGNPPFSVSLWVNPTSLSGGSIVHVSSNSQGSGTICFDLLALTSTGGVVAQLYQSALNTATIDGPILPVNTWTHLAVIYSYANGVRLFVNGQAYLTVTSASVGWPNTGVNPLYVTLGNNNPLGPSATPSCPSNSSTAVSGPYKGAIDEFRLYSRELDTQEICVLVNS